jgi:tRNA 2-thiocytidine biosynthesis protein TtcA
MKKFDSALLTTYRKTIYRPFIKALQRYHMVQEGDKIAVAISGGKDSLLMAKLFQELHKHPFVNFELEFLHMDPGYDQTIKEINSRNFKQLGIDVVDEPSHIFDILKEKAKGKPCYLCAKMRRGFLYAKAKELGCNKLALGHHYDDVIETTMLNMLYSGTIRTMLPVIESDNFEELTLIRPLYLIEEDAIKNIMDAYQVQTIGCGCELQPCDFNSKRHHVKQLIASMMKDNPFTKKNIFKSIENIDKQGVYKIVDTTDQSEWINNPLLKKLS